jgi:hypothetical protein
VLPINDNIEFDLIGVFCYTNNMKTQMPLPNWTHYRVVPEQVIKDHLVNFYKDLDWNRFCFDCTDYTQRVINYARPNWSAQQVEDFDIDTSIYIACL